MLNFASDMECKVATLLFHHVFSSDELIEQCVAI
jgi:hypothetical protein